ncbi:MAG: OmpA family protein [Limnospira sp.]
MTKASKPTRPTPKKAKSGVLAGLLTVIFRLLLLGVGSGVAWCVGMAIAQVYPDPSSEPPLTERLLRQWQGADEPAPSQVIPAPEPTSEVSAPEPQSLTPERQQTLQRQLQQLQQELNTLIGRTAALEIQIGNSRPGETLERRLQIIEQQLATATPTPPDTAEIPPRTPEPSASRSPDGLVVTLPSDILFGSGSGVLRPGANVILDNLLPDIQSYEGAVIRVGSHTDDTGKRQQNLDLSLQQAEAVVNYLSDAVESDRYHWVAVGYGSTRPTAENTSDNNRQLNRRVEVAIGP